ATGLPSRKPSIAACCDLRNSRSRYWPRSKKKKPPTATAITSSSTSLRRFIARLPRAAAPGSHGCILPAVGLALERAAAAAPLHVAVHLDQRTAHHAGPVFRAIGALDQGHVVVELTARDELAAEALDGHVGEREKLVEHHAVARRQLAFVGLLERLLTRGQARA